MLSSAVCDNINSYIINQRLSILNGQLRHSILYTIMTQWSLYSLQTADDKCTSQNIWTIYFVAQFYIIYIALFSTLEQTHSHVILYEWPVFNSMFLNIHWSNVLTALTWLVPHETAAVISNSTNTVNNYKNSQCCAENRKDWFVRTYPVTVQPCNISPKQTFVTCLQIIMHWTCSGQTLSTA